VVGVLAKHWLAAWLAQRAGAAMQRARSAEPGSRDFLIGAGTYAGLIDGGDALNPGSWTQVRKLNPPPPAAPTATKDVLAYLAGYLLGHASVSLAHQRAALRQPFWEPRLNTVVPAYTAVLATPDAQQMLALPGEGAVERAHQYACLGVSDMFQVTIDKDVEVMLFRWLADRSGVALPPDVNERIARLRLQRERRPPDSALGSAAS
jgi:hypothetical protein